jgi:hypothetical protein
MENLKDNAQKTKHYVLSDICDKEKLQTEV